MEWESWGDESTIELCEVRLSCDSSSLSMYKVRFLPQELNDLIVQFTNRPFITPFTLHSRLKRLSCQYVVSVYPSYVPELAPTISHQ
jgi:hypothetical protein